MYYRARYYDPQIGIFVSPDTIVPEPTNLLSYNRYMYGYGNPLRNVDPSGHANVDTAGFTAGYVETIAPVLPSGYLTIHEVWNSAVNWVDSHPNYDPAADPNLSPSQQIVIHAVYAQQHRELGNTKVEAYHRARQYGVDDPSFTAELALDAVDNGFGNTFGGPPILFGPIIPVGGRKPINSRFAGGTYKFTDPTLNAKYPNGVRFTADGYPDFSPYATHRVDINMKGNRTTDFTDANKAAGIEVKPAGYTWHHHENRKTMELIPTDLHDEVKHTGGVAIIKAKK